MTKVSPDFAPIEALPRTQNDLAILPRLDRSGMKSLNLDVPISIANRLRTEVTGSSTQAIAIIARWVLENLEVSGQRLLADPAEPEGYRLEPAFDTPWIDATKKNAVSASHPATHPMLASLPPRTHRIMRDECKGSLRRVVMSALEYGIQRLDADQRMLRLSGPAESSVREGRVLISAGDMVKLDKEQCAERMDWVQKARAILGWLGFDAVIFEDTSVVEEGDLLLYFGGIPAGISMPKEVQEVPACALFTHPVKWFALGGAWSVGMPDALIRRRGKFCSQCGYGESEGRLIQFQTNPAAGDGSILLCFHCLGMCSH